jgi:hypothetical protein
MNSSGTKSRPTAKPIPAFIINLRNHLERTFDLWSIKKPSPFIQLKRSGIFISCLLLTIYWPVTNLLTDFLILAMAWIILSLSDKPVSRWLLMLNLMLNIAWLYQLMRLFIHEQ